MNINTFDLNLLRVFDAIMREGNITAAGARLGLTQPAMSHALKRLRELCNDPCSRRCRRCSCASSGMPGRTTIPG